MLKKVLITISALILFGCAPAEPVKSVFDEDSTRINTAITRFVDTDAGVVCWLSYSRAISCLPIEDTLLK